MDGYQIINEMIDPKLEMIQFFIKRTRNHIKLVQKYCKKIFDYDPIKFSEILNNSENHDESKFTWPEKEPYLYITWSYKCKDAGKKFEIPEHMKNKMNDATNHHVKTNNHHPEFYSDKKVELINKEDRDQPIKEIIDATKMPDINIAEMVADWCAMSEEKGTGPIDWAKKNINVRWKFNEKQVKLIYELISNIWK